MTARWDAVHDGRRAFRACLAAMCAPGRPVGGLPAAGHDDDPRLDGAMAVLLALLDVGVGLGVVGDAATRRAVDDLLALTGAAPAPVCDADFVLVADDAGAAGEARRGTALHPEAGATIIYAGRWEDTAVVLEGPGLEAPAPCALALPPGELARLTEAAAEPPAGIDAFLVGDGRLTALPRSVLQGLA